MGAARTPILDFSTERARAKLSTMQTMRRRWAPRVLDARWTLNPGASASYCKISHPARVRRLE
eukprot:1404058-Pyramimonas_sp.AAC.1